jgi:superfamily I DNA/RNA helicase
MSILRLPQPIGRQKEVLCLPPIGHHVVLGTAGSGKTTLAIHRAFFLANRATDHCGRTLLVTFSKCLVAYLESLAGSHNFDVEVRNYHLFARGYLNSRGKMSRNCICGPEDSKFLCEQVLAKAKESDDNPLLNQPSELLLDEFNWIAKHGIRDLNTYAQCERVGRSAFRVRRAERQLVFSLYSDYLLARETMGKTYDWDDLGISVLETMRTDQTPRMYKHIVIDEGQDLSPAEITSLAASIPSEGSLTFFGDIAQQIYGRRMSWRSAGLTISSVWNFEENYRNTRQIAELALALTGMPYFQADTDLVTPKSPTADGPKPSLVTLQDVESENKYVAKIAEMLSQSGTVGVFFRDRAQETDFVNALSCNAVRLHRDLNEWPTGNGIFYGTYHSAKGLEFDSVILPHLSDANFPYPSDVEIYGHDDVSADDSRLLYVGITRAKVNLVITHTGTLTDLLPKRSALYTRSQR